MPKFNVHMAETRHFIIPVQAANTEEAREAARKEWRDAPTTGQWEISDTEEEILSVMQPLDQQERREEIVAKLMATITHEVTENAVRTIVKLPGQKPISKRWKRCDGGAVGMFKKDWEEDSRLDGWEPISRAAQDIPDFL